MKRIRTQSQNDLFEEEKFHRHMRSATQKSMQSEAMKLVISDGLKRAVNTARTSQQIAEQRDIEGFLREFLSDDEFRFKT